MSVADVTLEPRTGEPFEDRLGRTGRALRTPLTCLFEITPTCNLRCQFCYVALDPYQGPYLTTAQIKAVLDKLERAGVLWLTLTGGEIFSRRDFPEVYRYAKSRGFLVTLFTNATMMNERLAELLRELPPFTVEVSIYGHNAEIYEATTQIPGSFARFERGIALLKATGAPVVLKTPISTFTDKHLADLAAYAQAREFKFKVDLTIDARHDGGSEPTLYRISPKRVAELGNEMVALNSAVPQPRNQKPLPECSKVAPVDGPEELYRCGAGRTGFFIDALGNASHCVIDRDPVFPVLEMPWDDLWARMGAWVTQPLPKEAPCSGCGLRHSCGSCPARARLATGNPYAKDPYYCDISHELAGIPPLEHPNYRALPRPMGACAA